MIEPDTKLRKRAEQILQERLKEKDTFSSDEPHHLDHELQIHQIELELQNEELHGILKELRASQAKYLALYDFAPIGYVTVTKNGLITEVNRLCTTMFGKEKSALLGLSIAHLIVTEDRVVYHLHQREMLNTKNARSLDIRMKHRDGPYFYAHLECTPVLDKEWHVTHIRIAITDITEYKRAAEASQENEQRYRAIFEQAADSILLIDPETGKLVEFNDKAHENLGYTRAEFQTLQIHDFELIESPEEVQKHIEKIIKEGADTFETKHRTKRGEIRNIQINSTTIGIHGKTFIQTIWRDITEWKRAEEGLIIRDYAISSAISGIAISDLKGHLTYVNSAFLKIWGRDHQDEVLGKLASEFWYPPEQANEVIQALQERGTWFGELVGKRPDETLFDVEVAAFMILDEAKTPVGMAASFLDITERKQAEAEIQKYREHLEEIVAERTAKLHQEIKEREQAETEAESNAQRLQTVLETVDDGITLSDESGHFEIFNSRMETITGYTKAEANSIENFLRLLYPDLPDYHQALCHFQEFQRMSGTLDIETIICTKDGTRKTLLVSTSQIEYQGRKWYLSAYHDITRRRLVETEALLLRNAMNTAHVGVTITTADRIILYVNPAEAAMHGYTPAELIGKDARIFSSEDYWHDIPFNHLEEGWERETVNTRKDGATFPVHSISTPVSDDAGVPVGIITISEDITIRKHAEKALQQAKNTADAANQAKSDFLARMSHELRTPLNAILGYAQLLRLNENLPDKQREQIGIIQQSGNHLLAMINEVLDLAKIEAGKIVLELTEFHLPRFLISLADMIQVRAYRKGITFNTELAADLPECVRGDEKRLCQVLINLLSNAIKFTKKGRVTLEVTKVTEVKEEDLKSQIENLKFKISDTGIGIPADQLDNIFLPFEQVRDTQQYSEGTGLGLAISQKLVRIMGGELHVTSTVGKGSTFWFDLEFPVPVLRDVKKSVAELSRRIIGFQGEKRTILIADDNADNRLILKEILASLGFGVLEAVDGQDVLEKLVTASGTKPSLPDVILMDLLMPEMDGFETTRRIRANPELHDLIVIAISASPSSQIKERCFAAGCHDFLAKPVDRHELLNMLHTYLHIEWIYKDESAEDSFENGIHLTEDTLIPPHL